MSLEQFSKPVFAGHQTFHPRFGWIKKGLDACREDPEVYNAADAPLRLGVGKNMVEAIRFWCLATHVTAKVAHPTRPRTSVSVPTNLGEALLGKNGLDPYFEDPSTLWLLHWQAVSAGSMLPVWWSVFNELPALEFADDDLLRYCEEEIASTTWSQPNASSIKKDIDCLLRMYSNRQQTGRQTIDDLLDSPFREIGLIVPSPTAPHTHRFVLGPKPTLSNPVIAYACLDYMARSEGASRAISLSRLTADPGSPGRALKLTEAVILEALESEILNHEALQLASPGGASQLIVSADPGATAQDLMVEHHVRRGRKATVKVPGRLAGAQARQPLDSAVARIADAANDIPPLPFSDEGSAA